MRFSATAFASIALFALQSATVLAAPIQSLANDASLVSRSVVTAADADMEAREFVSFSDELDAREFDFDEYLDLRELDFDYDFEARELYEDELELRQPFINLPFFKPKFDLQAVIARIRARKRI
ncbi:hypothetical protein FA15DRAFT_661040 [Coprinopsis marcescibilis]|uniref:Uncharacterized protein n=1 Tax=Coprinopsis marcescibilis TaxID=230819 RepID=A0A5C3KDH3_COPMA|nr:hypothetical protein FA15DRAFT_661040 [Coprinopsis marcescibilis]